MNGVDLSLLPPPAVIEAIAFEAILADLKADFIVRHPSAAPLIDLESEPIVKLLETSAYRETLLRARYNDEARALLLAFATGTDLDHIGITYYDGETRLLLTPEDLDAMPPVAATWETDDDYRYRLSLKPESYSVAGPRDAFEFHAISASGLVKSAKPSTPHGGTSEIFILSRIGNGTPDQDLLDTVAAALNAEQVRPLSEEVIVSPATVIEYALDIALTLFPGASTELALAEANTRLEAFATSHHRLNADIIKSAIDAAAHVPGVKKVVITSPAADIDCGLGDAPWCTGITITIAGIEA